MKALGGRHTLAATIALVAIMAFVVAVIFVTDEDDPGNNPSRVFGNAALAPAACGVPSASDLPNDVEYTMVCTVPKPPTPATPATPPTPPPATETVTVTASPSPSASPTVTPSPSPSASPSPTASTTAPVAAKPTICMSAPVGDWSARVAEVGTQGLKGRRIFADLVSNGQDQSSLIQQAVAAGMMPVVSYKVPSFTSAASGSYDTWATAAANYLASFNVPVVVTIWHEPMSDMTGPQYVAMQNRLVPRFKGVGKLKVGPILNGFLLTQPNQGPGEGVNEFATYTSPSLLNLWDYFGIDTYQPGTTASPGATLPHERITVLKSWLGQQGHAGMPWGIGEYNGFSSAAISGVGEAILSDPNALFGCVWNSAAARAGILTGSRLTAYRATKADPRAQQ